MLRLSSATRKASYSYTLNAPRNNNANINKEIFTTHRTNITFHWFPAVIPPSRPSIP